MSARVTVKGLDPLIRALQHAGDEAPHLASQALYEEAQEAFLLSQEVTPIRYGALRSSGRVIPYRAHAGRSLVRIVYGGTSAGYALFVHEIPPSRAKHDPPTRWKYLEIPVKKYAEGMADRMAVRVLNILNKGF